MGKTTLILRFLGRRSTNAQSHSQVFSQCSSGSKGVGKTTLIHRFLERDEAANAHSHTQVILRILCSAGSKGGGKIHRAWYTLIHRFLERETTAEAYPHS